jgi:4-hydroxy-tetrahydrodipicolinate synthase
MASWQKGLLYFRGYFMKPGVYTAVVTPFLEDGSLDIQGFRENLRFQIASGVAGIVILGSTGEAPTLEPHEKKHLLHIAVEEVKDKVPLIVGTGSYSTKKTLEDTLEAKELGADAAMVVTPYYNKPTPEGLFQHFQTVSKASLPIIIYNVQGRTAQNLSTEVLLRLAELPEIIAVKDASGNISQMMDVIDKVIAMRPDFKVFSGDDNLTLPLICLGGHGIISVISNLLPLPIVEMVRLALDGDITNARRLHYSLLDLFKGVFIESNPIPIKAMMRQAGLPSGKCRLPLCDLTPENEKKVHNLLINISPLIYG